MLRDARRPTPTRRVSLPPWPTTFPSDRDRIDARASAQASARWHPKSGRAIHASRFQHSSVFDSRESGRPDSSGRANNRLLLVTLEKSGQREEHHHDDQFLSPTKFQWQSHKRTPQTGKVGQALENHHARCLTSTYSCLRQASLMDEQHCSPLLHRQTAVAVEQASTDSSREMEQPDT